MAKNILITAKKIPDIDGVACAIAYQEYMSKIDPHNKYIAAFQDDVHIEAKFVCEKLGIPIQIIEDAKIFDKYILVDMSEQFGLPDGLRTEDVIEVIDHRNFPSYQTFSKAKFRIELVGAAATQIAELGIFRENNSDFNFSPQVASLLLCAIYSNTINFKATITTFRDTRAEEYLEALIDAKNKNLHLDMYNFKSNYTLDNVKEVLLSDFKSGGTKFGLDEPVNIFQIETNNANKLLERREAIFKAISEITKDAKYSFLIVQDATQGETVLLTESEVVKKQLLSLNLGGTLDNNYSDVIIVPKIMMRKSILEVVVKREENNGTSKN